MEYKELKLKLLQGNAFNKADYRFIDSIKLEAQIEKAAENLKHALGVDYISCCLILPNGERYIFSNNPGGITIPYYEYKLNRIDNLFLHDFHRDEAKLYFLPQDIPDNAFGHFFTGILRDIYNVTNVAGFHREYQGIKLTTILGSKNREQKIHIPASWLQAFFDYVIQFLDQLMPYYVADKNALKYSKFYQDSLYRKRFILGELMDTTPKLKDREIQCLYWASQGKTVEETAMILNLKKSTIKGYLESVREKFNVTTTTEAVVKAVEQKIIT